MSGIGSRSAKTYDSAPPANYVAGIGRGAMGFTTRSDIGPARSAAELEGAVDPKFGQAPAGYVAGRGRGMGELARDQNELNTSQLQQEQDRGDYSESNYDEFSGYSERLFAVGVGSYDKEDAEADNVYDKVDEEMDNRRKRSRLQQQRLLEQKKARVGERPRIADQFADLKRELSTVSTAEWESIPDVGDHSLKLKQQRKKESYVPVPDSIIMQGSAAAGTGSETVTSLDPSTAGTGGYMSTLAGATSVGPGSLSGTRSVLQSRLDKMSDSVTGQTVVDPKGYLTSLNSLKINSAAEVGDIKKARLLLKSVTSTNPRHGPGWIASARLEEFAGKLPQARKVILQACETVPEAEDVWLEAARLHESQPDVAKTILANAVMQIPTSVRIWLAAADLECPSQTDADVANKSSAQLERRKAVLRRSLELVPNSVQLWKAAIELENVADARIMLARAVECVPHSVEMWLALAKLESHENARRVLNQAREAIPTERATWITAAKLEEAHGSGAILVNRIIEKMVASLLGQYQVVVDREDWIREAQDAEHAGAPLTCAAIIRNTIELGVEVEDRRVTWMDDADSCLQTQPKPCVETARAILAVALEHFPSKKSLWQQAAMLEKEYGTPDNLEAKLKDGVKYCPQAEVLWLMAAKEKWMTGNVPAARAVLLEAFHANPESQQIWLAAIKLEWENEELARARSLLAKARDRAPSERMWLKSALLEQEVGDIDKALQFIQEGLQKYSTFAKFYLMAAQICDHKGEVARARNFYLQGLKVCSSNQTTGKKINSISENNANTDTLTALVVAMWRELIRLEEKVKGPIKARPTCELARSKLPNCDLLWLESIRLERRAGNIKGADSLMAKALQSTTLAKSGALWCEEILSCPKPQQLSRCKDALKACVDNPLVLMAIAILFDRGGRPNKARRRFERAVALAPQIGDIWAQYYAFEYLQAFKMILVKDGSLLKSNLNRGTSVITGNTDQLPTNSTSNHAEGDPSPNEEGEGGIHSIAEDEDDEDEVETAPVSSAVSSGLKNDSGLDLNMKSEVPSSIIDSQMLQRLTLLERRCEVADPNQGENWCDVAKNIQHRRKKPVEKLRLVVELKILGFPLTYLDSASHTDN